MVGKIKYLKSSIKTLNFHDVFFKKIIFVKSLFLVTAPNRFRDIYAHQGGLKEQVQQSVNFLSLLSETIPLPKHRYQWASDRTELT